MRAEEAELWPVTSPYFGHASPTPMADRVKMHLIGTVPTYKMQYVETLWTELTVIFKTHVGTT